MRSIQEILLARETVIDNHGKTAGGGDDTFLAYLMSVASAHCSRGHIIEIVCALDQVGEVASPFNERKIAPMVSNLWEFDDRHLASKVLRPGRECK